MLGRLEEVEKRYEDMVEALSDPNISPSDIHRLSKERFEISEIVETYRDYKKTLEEIEKNRALLEDKELGDLAIAEISSLQNRQVKLEDKLRFLLLPKDPNDSKNVFLEIRAGTGGEEAALFAADLFRMYNRYAERNGWKIEIMNMNETGIGGFKEAIVEIQGKNVWSKLKYEGGVHRVQRVPTTEAGGRVHTSTATVAVLAEPDDVEITVDEKDLRIDTFRAGGRGGQHVNKTDSAVRITHLPTGIVVSCQNERSQHQNRAVAMKVLRARLFEIEEKKRQSELSYIRRTMVGSGDRSEKIRTYNFSQNRVTDHRIGLTLYKLEAILDGDLDDLVKALISHYQTENLKRAVGS
ncbi:MAG TPA: peptide chain release factor 1 [Thermodesulfobacteriota bacterium]